MRARQLLAFDTRSRLVYFEVFPQGVSDEIKMHFAQYNLAFHKAMDCMIYTGNEDAEIEFLLSDSWLQDYSWKPHEFKIAD